MDKAKKNRVIKLLKSGNFTLAFHDNGYFNIYKGKFDDYNDLKGKPIEVDSWGYGYTTVESELLTEALGGRVVSV